MLCLARQPVCVCARRDHRIVRLTCNVHLVAAVGIATGPVVSGVVGATKPKYSLFGECTASGHVQLPYRPVPEVAEVPEIPSCRFPRVTIAKLMPLPRLP